MNFEELAKIVAQPVGVAVIMFFVWYKERESRIDERDKSAKLSDSVTNAYIQNATVQARLEKTIENNSKAVEENTKVTQTLVGKIDNLFRSNSYGSSTNSQNS